MKKLFLIVLIILLIAWIGWGWHLGIIGEIGEILGINSSKPWEKINKPQPIRVLQEDPIHTKSIRSVMWIVTNEA